MSIIVVITISTPVDAAISVITSFVPITFTGDFNFLFAVSVIALFAPQLLTIHYLLPELTTLSILSLFLLPLVTILDKSTKGVEAAISCATNESKHDNNYPRINKENTATDVLTKVLLHAASCE